MLHLGEPRSDEIVADEGTISRNISDGVYDHSQFAHVINEPGRCRHPRAIGQFRRGRGDEYCPIFFVSIGEVISILLRPQIMTKVRRWRFISVDLVR